MFGLPSYPGLFSEFLKPNPQYHVLSLDPKPLKIILESLLESNFIQLSKSDILEFIVPC